MKLTKTKTYPSRNDMLDEIITTLKDWKNGSYCIDIDTMIHLVESYKVETETEEPELKEVTEDRIQEEEFDEIDKFIYEEPMGISTPNRFTKYLDMLDYDYYKVYQHDKEVPLTKFFLTTNDPIYRLVVVFEKNTLKRVFLTCTTTSKELEISMMLNAICMASQFSSMDIHRGKRIFEKDR